MMKAPACATDAGVKLMEEQLEIAMLRNHQLAAKWILDIMEMRFDKDDQEAVSGRAGACVRGDLHIPARQPHAAQARQGERHDRGS
jgi:hypothetical protein